MPKHARTSDFWKRLTLARTSCTPPKSMKQGDIAKEYGTAFQSAVTKWKTGGPDGTSLPSPETVTRMALDTNVNFNWLWCGQGDMRPLPTTDPITKRIVDAVNELRDPEAKLRVLEAAITQQTLQIPAVAAQLREAQDEARKMAERPARPALKRPGAGR